MSTLERSMELYYSLDALCRAGFEITIKRGPTSHILLAKVEGSGRRKRIISSSVYTVVQKAVRELLPNVQDMATAITAEHTAKAVVQVCEYHSGADSLATEIDSVLNNAHRTTQQCFMGMLKTVIERYGARGAMGQFDERNRASSEWARDVLSLNESQGHNGYSFPRI